MVPEKFTKSIIGWQKKLENNEWFFCHLSEEILNGLSPDTAFIEIEKTLELALNQNDEFLFIEVIELTLSLIRKSGTTELPNGIQTKIKELQNITNNFGETREYANNKISEIQTWYRIKSI